MKRILGLFFVLVPSVLFAQIDPAMIQQGIGTVVKLNNTRKDIKSKTEACRFTPSDASFVYHLMVEYNKEQLADIEEFWTQGSAKLAANLDQSSSSKSVIEIDSSSMTNCTKCVSMDIKSSTDIKNRAMARQILNQIKWSTTDYTPDELERKNRITNTTACAGQAVKVLGGMREQILSPLLGNVMPGAEGMMQGGGGGLGGMLGNIGGMLGGNGQ